MNKFSKFLDKKVEKKVQSFADVLNHKSNDKFSMFRSLFSPNMKTKQKTKLSRHFSGDRGFKNHPISPKTKAMMLIEDGNFKTLAEQEGLLSHESRPNSPHTKQNKGL